MFNVQFHFNYPWLFLLLIPAIALALIPYFRISKKYRRTRNRITSIVLHLVVMFLCITVLCGVNVTYEVYNNNNDLLIVVDASYSTNEEKEAKDEYILNVLSSADKRSCNIGIVKFGYDQKYVVPLTNDMSQAYSLYQASEDPDTTATDIASALTYADSLLDSPETSKIILISDGLETDGTAMSVIRAIASKGIRVDTVCSNTLSSNGEFQLVGATLPEYNVALDETFSISLTAQSNFSAQTPVTVTVYDNDEETKSFTADVNSGSSTISFDYSLSEYGLHSLKFVASIDSGELTQNNSYYSYIYLISHESILIIDAFEGESDALYNLLKDDYTPVVMHVSDEKFPTTLNELRQYDEVILNNIANSDLPEGFVNILQEYVYDIGGGLFTVGGSDPSDKTVAHAYDRDDMVGTLLQEMLPVQAIDYTPPLGLVIIVDVSGSMGSKIDAAKDAAVSIIKDETCLSERDYCGIMALATSYDELTEILPMTRQDDLLSAVYDLSSQGSTNFTPAITAAATSLRALYVNKVIQKMHVVVITDGGAFDYEKYLAEVTYAHDTLGVTFSFIGVDTASGSAYAEQMQTAATAGGGRYFSSSAANLTIDLKDDIRVPAIKDVSYGEFTPTLDTNSSYGSVISQDQVPSLFGFYGTKLRTGAEEVLSGEYGVPIYAHWKYGAGRVGSFMCDLNGDWSCNFMSQEGGVTFIKTIINKLFPAGDIRPSDFNVVLREENYTTQLSVFTKTDLADDETIEVKVTNCVLSDGTVTVVQPTASEGYSRGTLIIKDPGVYEVTISRYQGTELVSEYTTYKTFSYSAEYNLFNETDREKLMQDLATSGNGDASSLESADVMEAFEGFVAGIAKSYDPRFLMIILALILFLLDIAVRKFKFKWPHELVREYKEKKNK